MTVGTDLGKEYRPVLRTSNAVEADAESATSSKRKSTMSPTSEMAVPWLLRWYPVIALITSLTVSIPLAFYKWNLATQDETELASNGLQFTGQNLAQNVIAAWKMSVMGPVMEADLHIAYINAFGYYSNTSNAMLERRMTQDYLDPNGYFAMTGQTSATTIVQKVTPETRQYWERSMFETYGGNLGSKTNFTFWKLTANGTVVPDDSDLIYSFTFVTEDDLYVNNHVAVTSRVILVTNSNPGVVVFVPIFVDLTQNPPVLTKKKTDHLEALAGGGMDTKAITSNTLSSLSIDPRIGVFLFDMDGDPGSTFLAHYSSVPDPVYDNVTFMLGQSIDYVMSQPNDYIYTESFAVVGRRYQVVVMAKSGYINSQRTFFPFKILIISLVEPAFSVLFHLSMMILRN
ncbi:hypothetical protein HK101_002580 [Irineochytrium annulatum]|nr:hypothetical protein HK101_002580 [Irineochytrium annulatum]